MKQLFIKISAICMSAIVLFSTLSFTMDMHYCGDTLVDVALFEKAAACGMEQMKPSKKCGDKIEKTSCCADKQIIMEGQDDLKDNVVKVSFEQQTFLVSYVYSYISLFESSDLSFTSFVVNPPPLLNKDFQVLYETFLI